MQNIKCDIIISGAGMAGLSLLYTAFKNGIWSDEQIVVVDASKKNQNDRTWSFWKTEPTEFDQFISSTWKQLLFFSNSGERIPLQAPSYTYNTIRSIDFYEKILSHLKQFPNITFYTDEVQNWYSENENAYLITSTYKISGKFMFNSIYKMPELKRGDQYFLQHFKGVKIKCHAPVGVESAHLMDFRTSQEHGTSFFYTLPLTANEIFVEYTIFSKTLLNPEEYDQKIRTYLEEELKLKQYDIVEDEFGVIPMTDFLFKRFEGPIVHIGTAGGDTRASTGYTFINTQKTIKKILESYKLNHHPFFSSETIGLKQHLYDSTLLNVLDNQQYQGHQIFCDLFSSTQASVIFAFLDAETSIWQDLQIMKSLKVLPFLKSFAAAAYRRIIYK